MTFKEHCIALRKQDKSIIEIMKITDRPKSSVYQHIQGIPLSAEKMQKIRIASGKHIKRYALARKGKSAKAFHTFTAWSPGIV